MVKIKNLYKGYFRLSLILLASFILLFFSITLIDYDRASSDTGSLLFLMMLSFLVWYLSGIFLWLNILIAKLINYFIYKKKDPNIKIFKTQELSFISLLISAVFCILVYSSMTQIFFNLRAHVAFSFDLFFRQILICTICYIGFYFLLISIIKQKHFGILTVIKKYYLKRIHK